VWPGPRFLSPFQNVPAMPAQVRIARFSAWREQSQLVIRDDFDEAQHQFGAG
jgi:hypothetical protein